MTEKISPVLDQLMSDMECCRVWHTRSASTWSGPEFTMAMQDHILAKCPGFQPSACPPYEVLFVTNKAQDFFLRQRAILDQAARLTRFITDNANLTAWVVSKNKWAVNDLISHVIADMVEQIRTTATERVNQFSAEIRQQHQSELDRAQQQAVQQVETQENKLQEKAEEQQQLEQHFKQLNAVNEEKEKEVTSILPVKCIFSDGL